MHIVNQTRQKLKQDQAKRRSDTLYTLVCAIGVVAVMFTCLSILEWRYSQIDRVYQETAR